MITIVERSTLETKGFQLNYGTNDEVKKNAENNGENVPEKSESDVKRNSEDLGRYPVVYFNGLVIESTKIQKLVLKNDSSVPSLHMEFNEPTGKILDENYPLDNSIISIFQESTNQNLMAIKMDFKITDFETIKTVNNISYIIDAIINVDDFYMNNFESYIGTSYDVLKKMSLDIGLGFATNISNTKDSMTWINPSNYKIEFMKEIVRKAYISDNSFLFGYVDFYYNFNYVDIETQMKDDISAQMNIMDREKITSDNKDDVVSRLKTFLLKEFPYITGIRIVNSDEFYALICQNEGMRPSL